MDSIFLLGEGERAAFLQQMVQSFGCAYICLWSYLPPPSNCLLALDGIYRDGSDQPSSSSGSLARRLFDAYRESVNFVDSGRIPGFAFKNNLPYMELKLHDLQRMASSEVQLHFYQTVVFMGCATGEIELGMSNDPQVDLQIEMKNLFPDDFSRQAISGEKPPPTDPNRPPSSSSSSLRSLSVDGSTEYSPLLFNIPTSSFIQEPAKESLNIGQTVLGETLRSLPISAPLITTTSPDHHQAAIQALSQIRNVQFPTIESEDSAMTKAILAVLSSPSSTSSSCHQQIPQNLPPISHSPTAFRTYPSAALPPVAARSSRKHSMFKRAVSFFRNLNMRRRQELQIQGNRPTTTQLHHMISERRRREKLNESFQVLRSLLPPGSKKDKASVLSSTTEYMSSLISQVEELRKRNQMLESQLSARKSEASDQDQVEGSSSSVERVNVEINQVSSSTSEARFLDLRVTVRGESSMLDLIIRVLEFLKQQRNVSLLSVESNTRMLESIPVHRIMLRLKIEGDEFDESAFQEAVTRVCS
ncbi:putative transcription factor [Sesamum alatum]|uniref:Transcription factor n=1 Tax=Sesamum alatum TaxID=300844 RepID=A0AAE1XQB9_9LAMI|nr:putative transcription factor [Sesamum alatum]